MKLCWWTIFPTTYQSAIVSALRRRGVDVVVCYFGHYDPYRQALGWVPPKLNAWEFEVADPAAARQVIPDFDERIQMVPSYADRLSWRLMRDCVRRRLPWFAVVERSTGSLKSWPVRKLFARWVDRWSLGVFCIGAEAERQFRSLGVRSEKIHPFAYAVAQPTAADADGGGTPSRPEHDGCQFVYAGALNVRKAVDVLAEAWQQVAAACPSARLRVIGDGGLRSALEGLPGVELVGAVRPEAVYGQMAGGDVIVLPSRYDAWGVALCEGALCGMAMVAPCLRPNSCI